MKELALPSSFRDPAGFVFEKDGRVFRALSARGVAQFDAVSETGLLQKLVQSQAITSFAAIPLNGEDPTIGSTQGAGVERLFEHPRLDYISYPYEWPFALLKSAALHQLDVAIEALDHGVSLSDATAFNVQFDGVRPVFIDLLSFQPYQEGDFWLAQGQFCNQFLHPLLLRSVLGVSHSAWYRGTLEGVSGEDLVKLLPTRALFSFRMLLHVFLPAWFQTRSATSSTSTAAAPVKKRLPKASYRAMLTQLRDWIAALKPRGAAKTVWQDYEDNTLYDDDEEQQKRAFVTDFVTQTKPAMLFDLGCNSGAYSELALEAGAQRVIGFDFDQGALDLACARASQKSLKFTPLHLDASNPSPNQGWREKERPGFGARANADAALALAFVHHLAIGKNLPLGGIVAWLADIAPRGVVEFVPKEDPKVQHMLRLREDIFADYTPECFEGELSKHFTIVKKSVVSKYGRSLYFYEKKN